MGIWGKKMLNYYKSQNDLKKKYVMVLFLVIILMCLLIFCAVVMMKGQNKSVQVTKNNEYENNEMGSKVKETFNKKTNLAAVASSIYSKNDIIISKKETGKHSGDKFYGAAGGEVAPWKEKRTDGSKVAYLTFDDGPSNNTDAILGILNKYNIKATFFLVGSYAERRPDLVKKEFSQGMSIGNHTYSHQINYAEGPENFVKDLNKCDEVLKSICGEDCYKKLARFPGGSFYNKLIPFREAAEKSGYRYVDWNDATDDAIYYNPPVPFLINSLQKYTKGNTVVVLMHDAAPKTNTVEALPQVIEYLKSLGYIFETLN